MLLFNGESALSYFDIKKITGMEDQDLCRTLQSLACAKLRVLRKNPQTREINDMDVFEFNTHFTNPLKRLTINQIQAKETQIEQAQTEERVFEDRQFTIDACIVRIMKTRKTISHQSLCSELFESLKFPVQVINMSRLQSNDLKKRIESLIERDFIERSDGGSGNVSAQMYNYLA